MVVSKPRVSIGLPVFNGEKYLRQALDSILAQTFQDFELIISDNASSDKTQHICREYAERDSRIRYYRNRKNLGAAWNFNRVFKLSLGVYFKWAAHDDVIAPEFLSKCVKVLDEDPSIVLCHSKTARINENGVMVGTYHSATNDSQKPHERLRNVLSKKGFPWMIFGVMRTNALSVTHLMRNYIGSDWNLLAEISLIGRIYEIPEYLFFRRDHQDAFTNKHFLKRVIPNYQNASVWWKGNKRSAQIIFPRWKNCLEFFKSVRRAPISWYERWLCYKEIGRWLIGKGWRLMKWDVAYELNSFRLNLARTGK